MSRIAFIHSNPLYPTSGENIRTRFLIDILVREGHKIDLIAPQCSSSLPKGVNYYCVSNVDRFSKSKFLEYLKFALFCPFQLSRLKGKYDFVYCFGFAGTALAVLLSKIKKCPLICDFYEVDFLEFREGVGLFFKIIFKLAIIWERKVITYADKLIVLSKALSDYAYQKFNVRAAVVYDAADTSIFKPIKSSARERKTLIFHGGIEARDGIENLLKAAELALMDIDFDLLIIGKGSCLKKYKDYVQRSKVLKERVTFTGWIDYGQIPLYLNKADIAVVVPQDKAINRYVIPRKLYEYMSCGIPVVASNLPAIREVLDESNAILVRPDDIKEIAKAIQLYFKDKEIFRLHSQRLLVKSYQLNLENECKRLYSIVFNIK